MAAAAEEEEDDVAGRPTTRTRTWRWLSTDVADASTGALLILWEYQVTVRAKSRQGYTR